MQTIKLLLCVSFALFGCIINIMYWEKEGDLRIHSRINEITKFNHKRYFTAMIILTVVFAFLLVFLYRDAADIFMLKRIAEIVILWAVAWWDYKEHIIPNRMLIIGLIYWCILSVCEAILYWKEFKFTFVAEILVAVLIYVILSVVNLLSKGGIGMGDIKLLAVMALFEGGNGYASAVLLSSIILFFTAVFLLISKRRKRGDFIPFGPAILIGTYISILTTGA